MDPRDTSWFTRSFFLLAGLLCGAVALFDAGSKHNVVPAAILGAGFFLGFAHLIAMRR